MKTKAEQVADEDIGWLMESRRGRRIMWRLLSESGVFRNPFAGERGATDFRCGEMNQGQRLLARVHRVAPEQYVLMVAEAAVEGNQTEDA